MGPGWRGGSPPLRRGISEVPRLRPPWYAGGKPGDTPGGIQGGTPGYPRINPWYPQGYRRNTHASRLTPWVVAVSMDSLKSQTKLLHLGVKVDSGGLDDDAGIGLSSDDKSIPNRIDTLRINTNSTNKGMHSLIISPQSKPVLPITPSPLRGLLAALHNPSF